MRQILDPVTNEPLTIREVLARAAAHAKANAKPRRRKSRTREPLEKDIQDAILAYLKAQKVLHWRQNTGATVYEDKATGTTRRVSYGIKGCADILAVVSGGRLLAIEVKRPSGKQSPEQVYFQERVEKAGGIYILAKSLEDVQAALRVYHN